MRTPPKLGQTIYSLNVGNAARNRKQCLTPVVVTKVGRKYFTAGDGHLATEYHLDTWREKTQYCEDSKLYESEKEYSDEKESRDICETLRNNFEHGWNKRGLPIEALRRILEIIESTATKP